MMFFKKPHLVALITRTTIHFIARDGTITPIELPPEITRNLEIIDEKRLSTHISDFLTKNDIKNKRILIVLDQSVLFRKDIPFAKDTDPQALRDDFISKIPFDSKSRRVLTIQQLKILSVVATNEQLYSKLVTVLNGHGNKILAVIPESVFHFPSGKKLTQTNIQHMFQITDFRAIDFLVYS